MKHLKIIIRGRVQGVGFRYFVWRLAEDFKLQGWVRNSGLGVEIEIQGPAPTIDRFMLRLREEAPPRSIIDDLEITELPESTNKFSGFEIISSV